MVSFHFLPKQSGSSFPALLEEEEGRGGDPTTSDLDAALFTAAAEAGDCALAHAIDGRVREQVVTCVVWNSKATKSGRSGERGRDRIPTSNRQK